MVVDPHGIPKWLNGENVTFMNVEPQAQPQPGEGVVIFESSPQNAANNHVDISLTWKYETIDPSNVPDYFVICEYQPQLNQAGPGAETPPTTTQAPTSATTTTPPPINPNNPQSPQNPTNPQNPQNPALYSNWNRPMNMGNFFGGAGLYEVPRRPANYRMNPYYAMP